MRRRSALLAACAVVVLAVPASALGAFTAPAGTGTTYSTAVLADPAALTATIGTCRQNQLVEVVLDWIPTGSGFADGYEVRRSVDGSPEQTIGLVTNASVTRFVDTTSSWQATHTYRVVATAGWWRSAGSVTATVTTPRHNCRFTGGPGG